MFSKFLSLDPQKQVRIINSASKEFASKGYDKASTNEIVKEADISKGLLFHYFSTKKDLYLFLYDFLQELFANKIFSQINWEEKDIFNRYRQIALLKFDLFKNYPELVDFLKSVYFENSVEVKDDLERRKRDLIAVTYQKLTIDYDCSKFKADIDPDRAMNIIFWTLEGFANQQQAKAKNLSPDQLITEDALAEMEIYLEMLRKSFYK